MFFPSRHMRSLLVSATFVAFFSLTAVEISGNELGRGSTDISEKNEDLVRVGPEGVSIVLDADEMERFRLEADRLHPFSYQPEISAYGRLEEDPSCSFVLRAPLSGIVRVSPGTDWPSVGSEWVRETTIGFIQPILSTVEIADLKARLLSAENDVEKASASLKASLAAYHRAQNLHHKGGAISENEFDRIEAKAKEDEADLRVALQTVSFFQSTLAGNMGAVSPTLLVIRKPGQVIEAFAQPGETVQAGQKLIRVCSYDSLLARVAIPYGKEVDPGAKRAWLAPVGYEDHPVTAEVLGPVAPAERGGFGSQTLLLRVKNSDGAMRPGWGVVAGVPEQADPVKGFLVPASAVIRFQGRTWVYTGSRDSGFARFEIPVEKPVPGGYFLTRDQIPPDPVITVGAESLLSIELGSEIQMGEEDED